MQIRAQRAAHHSALDKSNGTYVMNKYTILLLMFNSQHYHVQATLTSFESPQQVASTPTL